MSGRTVNPDATGLRWLCPGHFLSGGHDYALAISGKGRRICSSNRQARIAETRKLRHEFWTLFRQMKKSEGANVPSHAGRQVTHRPCLPQAEAVPPRPCSGPQHALGGGVFAATARRTDASLSAAYVSILSISRSATSFTPREHYSTRKSSTTLMQIKVRLAVVC